MKKSQARLDAIAAGLSSYIPESPCARGHLLRNTSGSCIECRRLNEKARYYADPEKTKCRVKDKYQRNANVLKARRRAAKMQRTPAWLTVDDFWMLEQAYELAALRTKMLGFAWHVDHIIPLQGKLVSGLHVPTNIRVIPGVENVRKANRYVPA